MWFSVHLKLIKCFCKEHFVRLSRIGNLSSWSVWTDCWLYWLSRHIQIIISLILNFTENQLWTFHLLVMLKNRFVLLVASTGNSPIKTSQGSSCTLMRISHIFGGKVLQLFIKTFWGFWFRFSWLKFLLEGGTDLVDNLDCGLGNELNRAN